MSTKISYNVKNNEQNMIMEEARKAQEEFDRIMPMVNSAIAGKSH